MGLRVSCVLDIGVAFFGWVLSGMAALAFATASYVRASAFRSKVLNLANTCSIGLRSGEYLGRNTRRAPTARMACRIAFPLVGAEIVEDNDVARLEGRGEELFDIGAEAFAVDGAVEQAGRIDPVIAQGGKKRRGLPAAMRNLVDEALSFRRPAAQPGHVGFRPGLVDEHQSLGIDAALIGSPSRAMAAYVRTILLARDKGLFLNVTPRRRKKRLIIEVSDLTPRSHKRRSHSVESVMSVF